MRTSISDRVQKHRAGLRAAGLRPVQIWVPDTRRAGFAEECHRQSLRVVAADSNDAELMGFMDAALEDTEGWKE
ncbi:MAG: antitoxin MazE family protein [Pseudomonadota bacterium]|nr:antitoxin MazE family protein [Pseudomonadota bacterium]